MAKIAVQQRIDAPVESVFQLCSDFENAAGRIKAIKKIEMLSNGPVGVGTRFRETRTVFNREATEEFEVKAFDPPRSYTLTCESCGCRYTSVFRFVPDGTGTVVSADFTPEALSLFAKLMAPMMWFMRGMLKKCLQQDLNDIKALAEAPMSNAPAVSAP